MERLPLVVLQEILRCLVPWSCSKDELSEMADRMWRAQAFKGHLPPAARSGKIEASGQRIALGRCIFSSPTPPESAEPAPLLLNLVFLSRAGPQAHAAVGWLTTWMPDHIAQVLHGFALQGQLHVLPTDCCNAHRNAYASAVRRRDAAGLHWIINEAIILPTGSVWNHRDQILQLACGTTWMPLIQHISHLYGFGNFWPNIVAWNMRAIGIATAYPTDLPIWPRQFNTGLFKTLKEKASGVGADLENIVYYRGDESHYMIMTPSKQHRDFQTSSTVFQDVRDVRDVRDATDRKGAAGLSSWFVTGDREQALKKAEAAYRRCLVGALLADGSGPMAMGMAI
ncbi:hypothetical protein AK812_SmicGene17358 [Symbiodinium microadriaticum]|uniref:[F-actin]-monooxygenase MICAL1-3-like Rossman domain-containing protein n=1 Tax=Symbiodinium microadriaticum TaxID=2951 RepID=A0A1Q9DY07_SYMMI|nr:hypothetical protein AK812_SmicGene17358 [Symbiodinium microadriaticum]